MRFLGNIIWVLFGGLLLAILWLLAGLLLCITVIGIPFGLQCFKIAGLALWPFGRQLSNSMGAGSLIMNILWILVFGWEIALITALIGLIYCITVIGIPFGLQCFKLASLALLPFGTRT